MRRLLTIAMVFSGCGSTSAAAPTLDELRALLDTHRPHGFDASSAERGCEAGTQLGEYVDLLVANGTGHGAERVDGDVARLEGGCGTWPDALAPVDPPRDDAYFYCRIDSYVSDAAGESPWHYELRVRVRRSDRAVDLETLGCPGSS